jgi:16S rRNA (adenine1518-N6/adenine1519-N6)-dimethyltransferase
VLFRSATGNLPYQLTGLVLMRLVEMDEPPARAVVLVQREVAARLAAGPGDWSLATVAMRSLATVERVLDVPPSAFDPPPAVHSSIIRIVPTPGVDRAVRASMLAIAKPLFQSRRKTLRNGVTRALGGDLARAGTALADAGIDPGRRPGTLGLDEWELLARAVAEVRLVTP